MLANAFVCASLRLFAEQSSYGRLGYRYVVDDRALELFVDFLDVFDNFGARVGLRWPNWRFHLHNGTP